MPARPAKSIGCGGSEKARHGRSFRLLIRVTASSPRHWRLPSNNMTALAMANRQPFTIYPNG